MGKLNLSLKNKFVNVISLEDAYLSVVSIPPNIKLSRNLVWMNYGHLSIYKDGDLIYLKKGERLYIWFTPYELSSKIPIPESYLIYRLYNDFKGALVIKNSEVRQCMLIIKDGNIEAQICKKNFDDLDLNLVKKKYGLKSPEIITIDNSKTFSPRLKDIMMFLPSVDFEFENFLLSLYEGVKLPLIVFLLLLNIFVVLTYSYTNHKIKEIKNKYLSIKSKNMEIKKEYETLQKYGVFFKKFYSEQLSYPTFYATLNMISKIMLKNKAKINSFRQYMGSVDLEIISTSTSAIVKDLLTSHFFKRVEILSTSQYYADKSKEISRLRLVLKRHDE